MNILHISSGDKTSGVTKGAYNLHSLIKNKKGVRSYFFSPKKIGKNSVELKKYKLKYILYIFFYYLEKIFKNFYLKRKSTSFTSAFFGINFMDTYEYKKADIIHFHWLGKTFINLNFFNECDKPIVFSLRDMWFFTGGCHYTLGCQNFKKICNKCPQLGSTYKYDLSYISHKRKKNLFNKKINIVAVSKWIKRNFKYSSIGKKNFKVRVIENIVNKKNFYPEKKNYLYKKLKKRFKNKKILIYGASNISAEYKGFNHFIEIIKKLDKEKYGILIFGNFWENEKINQTGLDYIHLGYINSEKLLRQIYNCGDAFITTATQDAFPKTFVESMLCSIPVVCFEKTSISDYLIHKKNSYISNYLNYSDFANGIHWLSFNKKIKKIKSEARKSAIKHFNDNNLAKKHIELYKEILKEKYVEKK